MTSLLFTLTFIFALTIFCAEKCSKVMIGNLGKENVYRVLPNKKTSNDWLARNEILSRVFYDNEDLLAQFDENHIKIYYKSGHTAIDVSYYPGEDIVLRRFVLREDGCQTPLGILDTLGRGVIYDHVANVRLRYNQTEGVLLDSSIGVPRIWKWIQQCKDSIYENVIKDTYISPPDEEIIELLALDKGGGKKDKAAMPKDKKSKTPGNKVPEPVIKEIDIVPDVPKKKPGKLFKICSLKPLTMKISDYFTLVILDQKNIHLYFRYDRKKMVIELGVVLTDDTIETNLMDPECGSTLYEEIPPRTESIAVIHEDLKEVKIAECERMERVKRLKFLQGMDS